MFKVTTVVQLIMIEVNGTHRPDDGGSKDL
jgi:hypothetical protein